MNKKNTFKNGMVLLFAFLIFSFSAKAQLTILNGNFNTFNITPRSICEVNIMNYGSELQVVLEAKLFNSNNEQLLTVKTSTFLLKKGLNSSSALGMNILSAVFSSSAQGQYLQSSHTLSSGRFHYCVVVTPVSTLDAEGADFCEDIESDLSSFLFLVDPADKDTIETQNPLLLWSHSEPFNLLTSGEFYRLVLVELNPDQSAEAGITSNSPVFMKNSLRMHQVQYPFDAKELAKGKRYGWQVQRVTNGVITNKSEAWEFICKIHLD